MRFSRVGAGSLPSALLLRWAHGSPGSNSADSRWRLTWRVADLLTDRSRPAEHLEAAPEGGGCRSKSALSPPQGRGINRGSALEKAR